MHNCLGYDCDGNEIYKYRILRSILSNDIDIEELKEKLNRILREKNKEVNKVKK